VFPVDERFRKRFPHLAAELGGPGTVRIDSVRSSIEEGERIASSYPGYEPGPVEFIRRCDTEEQALEIINYLEERGEISHEYAARLRRQLVERGLRSFGPKREPGCYERGEP
jgi:hypothetical protein